MTQQRVEEPTPELLHTHSFQDYFCSMQGTLCISYFSMDMKPSKAQAKGFEPLSTRLELVVLAIDHYAYIFLFPQLDSNQYLLRNPFMFSYIINHIRFNPIRFLISFNPFSYSIITYIIFFTNSKIVSFLNFFQ